MTRWALLVAGLLLLAACGEETGDANGVRGADADPLDGRTLVVTGVTEGGAPRPLVPGTQIRLSFSDGQLGIQAGCNSMSGAYQLDGDQLSVGGMAGTDMGCPEPQMAQDTWVAGLFESPVTLVADPLSLTSGSTVLELADREDVSPDLPLAGTAWVLDSLIESEAVSSVPMGVEASLTIGADGAVSVRTGCNNGSGRVEIGDGTLTWGPLATTRRACTDDGAAEVERHLLGVLAGATAYEITERSLTITHDGTGVGFVAR